MISSSGCHFLRTHFFVDFCNWILWFWPSIILTSRIVQTKSSFGNHVFTKQYCQVYKHWVFETENYIVFCEHLEIFYQLGALKKGSCLLPKPLHPWAKLGCYLSARIVEPDWFVHFNCLFCWEIFVLCRQACFVLPIGRQFRVLSRMCAIASAIKLAWLNVISLSAAEQKRCFVTRPGVLHRRSKLAWHLTETRYGPTARDKKVWLDSRRRYLRMACLLLSYVGIKSTEA